TLDLRKAFANQSNSRLLECSDQCFEVEPVSQSDFGQRLLTAAACVDTKPLEHGECLRIRMDDFVDPGFPPDVFAPALRLWLGHFSFSTSRCPLIPSAACGSHWK